jgi:hypothetical protein
VSMEYRKAAQRDAERAKLMRRAAALLREMDRDLLEAGIEKHTVSAAVCNWELEASAQECDGDALCEFEDTPVHGIRVKR